MGKNSDQRAKNIYSAVGTKYSAPKYSAPVGDALSDTKITVSVVVLRTKGPLIISSTATPSDPYYSSLIRMYLDIQSFSL
jgi:hypothetical protein